MAKGQAAPTPSPVADFFLLPPSGGKPVLPHRVRSPASSVSRLGLFPSLIFHPPT